MTKTDALSVWRRQDLGPVNYDLICRVLIPNAAVTVVCWMSALTKVNVGEAIRVANNVADAT